MELQIHDVAFGGKGVGRADGKVFFVPFTIAGERVTARVVREKKQFAEADLVDVLEPSANRTTPECPYFGRCGGCSYQHINYAHQLEVKHLQVEQALRRIGHIDHPPMHPIIPSPKPYEYRNRITVHAAEGLVGYFRRDAHRLIDVERCPIARPEVNQALTELRARRPHEGHYTLRAQAGPRIFAQTNDEVATALAELVRTFIPEGASHLIDAYCGAGFFTKRLADRFAHVIGIEWDRFAIEAANATAGRNETYIAGDVEVELLEQLQTANRDVTCVILDPPATGLSQNIREALSQNSPQTLIYVSCNPATLARDLKELKGSFALKSVTPLDMFPQTAEIECVVHLERIAQTPAATA